MFLHNFTPTMSGGGTIDLDWSSLTPELARRVNELLNTALSSATRPSFIGPITVSSFEFGTAAPDIELVDIRDIYPDFLEDDEQEEDAGRDTIQPMDEREQMLDDFEWVSGRDGTQSEIMLDGSPGLSHYGPSPPRMYPAPASAVNGVRAGHGPWGPGSLHAPGLSGSMASLSRTPTGTMLHGPFLANTAAIGQSNPTPGQHSQSRDSPRPPETASPSPGDSRSSPRSTSPSPGPSGSEHPDLQLHFRIAFESNMRLAINTSLQINYPSPMIMALPIKLCLTGLVLDGELVVAYEGSRRRIHMCFLDDLATHGGPVPASRQRPLDSDEAPVADDRTPAMRASASMSRFGTTPSKPSPAGVRLLPSIVLESEIGQEDKHVLRNVARVERFIQDVIRKTIEEELVFPNYQTIVLPNPNEN